MSRKPPQPYQDPFASPSPHPRIDSESDMDHYDRRDTFQSENSGAGGVYDNHNYDPYCSYIYFIFVFIPFASPLGMSLAHTGY